MDEQPRQLMGETRHPIPATPGQVERYDYEYVRNGTVNNFMFFEPLGNGRRVSVRGSKTQRDWAEEVAHLLDIDFPDAQVVVLVCDNFAVLFFRGTKLERCISDFRQSRLMRMLVDWRFIRRRSLAVG